MRSAVRSTFALGALAALAGCTTVEDPFLTGSTATMATPSPDSTREIAPHLALASLPGAGEVVAVRQTLAANGTQQTIVFANPSAIAGENTLTVKVGTDRGKRFREAPSRSELQAEMRAAIPGVAMAINNTINQNAYGIYGYAVGRASTGVSCIYAWQIVEPSRQSAAGSSHGASIRLRLCRSGDHAQQLAGLMRALDLKPLDAAALAALRAPSGALNLAYQDIRPVQKTREIQEIAAAEHRAEAIDTSLQSRSHVTIDMPDSGTNRTSGAAAAPSNVRVPMPQD